MEKNYLEKIEGLNYIGIETIKPYPYNTKKHSETQIEALVKLIKLVGFNVPIVIDKDNIIIAGHGRLMAAQKLEMKEVPYVKKDNLTEEQVKIYRIADNTIAESEGHDLHIMADEYKKILENVGLEEFSSLIGQSEQELIKTISYSEEDKQIIEDDITKVDQVYTHKITCPFCNKSFEKKKEE